MYNKEKVYFIPGDLVELKQDIPNKPLMMVKKVVKNRLRDETSTSKKETLLGVECFWFTTSGQIQKETFSTKDLRHTK